MGKKKLAHIIYKWGLNWSKLISMEKKPSQYPRRETSSKHEQRFLAKRAREKKVMFGKNRYARLKAIWSRVKVGKVKRNELSKQALRFSPESTATFFPFLVPCQKTNHKKQTERKGQKGRKYLWVGGGGGEVRWWDNSHQLLLFLMVKKAKQKMRDKEALSQMLSGYQLRKREKRD